MGEAYVSLATEHPAHCQVMFRTDVIDPDDPHLVRQEWGPTASSTERSVV